MGCVRGWCVAGRLPDMTSLISLRLEPAGTQHSDCRNMDFSRVSYPNSTHLKLALELGRAVGHEKAGRRVSCKAHFKVVRPVVQH